MPLLRIEKRPKQRQAATTADHPPRQAPERPRRPSASGSPSAVPAWIGGAFIGVLAIVGISAFLIARTRGQGLGPSSALPAGAPGGQAVAAPDVTPLAPGPINGDYAPDAVVAVVSGEPYTMASLEKAVRVSRVLGKLGGDPVPDYGTPEMKGFQVEMLKRQVQMILIRQATARDGMLPPNGPVDDLIGGYVQKVGATDARLEAELTANGVTRADLTKWFEDSRTTNFYIQEKLMVGKDPATRKDVAEAWLGEEWERREVYINFYDPDQLKRELDLIRGARPTAGAPAGSTPGPGDQAP